MSRICPVSQRSFACKLMHHTLFLTACVSLPAMAQTESGNEPRVLGQIVVTAERREGLLQETPVAVSAFDAEALADLQVTTTQDIERLVPGLKLVDNLTHPTNFTISLRGSTQQDASLVVAESPVGIYVDDIYIARLNGANAQLADIERVEVLRGPQGTLYGRNTLAGAMKFISASPGESLRLSASASAGEDGRYRVSGAISGPIGEGWSASVAGLADGMDGYFTNLATNQTIGEQANYAARAKLKYSSAGMLSGEAFISWAESTNDGYLPSFALFPATPTGQVRSDQISFGLGGPYLVSIAPNPSLPPPVRALPEGKTEQVISGLKLGWDFGQTQLNSITGYVSTKDFFSVEFTGVGAFPGANRSDTTQWSQELQLLGAAFDDRLDWIAGVYLFTEEADQIVALVTDDLLKINTDSVAVFGQATYALTEKLSLTAGARWTEDKKDFEGTIRQFGSLAPIFPSVRLSNTYTAFTPKFTIDYNTRAPEIFDSLLLYASAARGFKSGGYNGIAFGNIDVLNTPYAPEKNWTYEGGVKADMLGRRLRVNAAAFFNDISDIALNATSTGPGGVSFPIQNAGDAEVKGLELEISARLSEGLDLFANLTLQDGKYTRLNPGSEAAIAEQLYGSVGLAQLPDYAYTVGGSYTFASPFQSGAEFRIGADHSYTDDYFIAVGNAFIVKGYGQTNAFAAYRWNDSWEARLSVTNIEDNADIISGVEIFSSVTVTAPRTAMFTLSYRR